MGKKGKWLSAVKNVFRSSSKESGNSKEVHVPVKNTDKPEEATDTKKHTKEKRRWRFGKSAQLDSVVAEVWQPAICSGKFSGPAEVEHNKHAGAVATPEAAKVAVTASQAASEVLCLTESARPSYYAGLSKQDCAAIKIQTAFRGFLARRALRGLRGLVRLQALVRGHTVRRQATLTLRCMQALVRVQARVRARRARMSEEGQAVQRQIWQRRQHENLAKRGNLDLQEEGIWDDSVQSAEEIQARKLGKQEAALKRERALAYAFSHQLWRSAPKQSSSMFVDGEPNRPHWGWSWFERWMAVRPWEAHLFEEEAPELSEHIPRLKSLAEDSSTSVDSTPLQMKVGKPSGTIQQHKTTADSLPTTPFKKPSALIVWSASPRIVKVADEEGSVISTARSTQSIYSLAPRFQGRRNSIAGSSIRDDESLVSSPAVPNYMAATQSAKAKARSSARQRLGTPGADQNEHFLSAKKRQSFPISEASSAYSTPKYSRPPAVTLRSPNGKGVRNTQRSTTSVRVNSNGDTLHTSNGNYSGKLAT